MGKGKLIFAIYCFIIVIVSIGWYPKTEEHILPEAKECVLPQKVTIEKKKEMKTYQEILENKEEERMAVSQKEEQVRRNIKRVKRERISIDKNSRRILERIVEAEAGNQTIRGRQMVANVILNRVQSKKFPDTVKEVVFAHRQFSPIQNGRYYQVSVSVKTKKAVEKALKEKDNTKGALYFMYRAGSDKKNVSWFDRDLTKLCHYGCHEFFK